MIPPDKGTEAGQHMCAMLGQSGGTGKGVCFSPSLARCQYFRQVEKPSLLGISDPLELQLEMSLNDAF